MTHYSFDKRIVEEAINSASNHFSGLDVASFAASPANAYLSLSGG
jgi:hypothetical protein